MTDHPIRLFPDETSIRRVGTGLLDRTLPKEDWTHEAHLAACLWLVRERPDVVPERDLPEIISCYNESVGGQNTDSAGYHETLTQLYVYGVKAFNDTLPAEIGLPDAVNDLLESDIGRRDWPLRFYSRECLFSVESRRGWVAPDLAPLP